MMDPGSNHRVIDQKENWAMNHYGCFKIGIRKQGLVMDPLDHNRSLFHYALYCDKGMV